MNAMEGRTREALHRVADGLIVSEHDLDRMEGNLMTLLDSRPTDKHAPPRPRKDWAVAAAAAVALVVSGVALWQASHDSSPTQPAVRPAPRPSLVPPELVGLWQATPDSSWLWEFTADGRILNTSTADGYLRGTADLRGGDGAMIVTERHGNVYTLKDTNPASTDTADPTTGSPDNGCGTRIQVVAPETVSFGSSCSDGGITLRLERVSPRDQAAPALGLRFPAAVARPVTLVAQLDGTWVNRETNKVLVVGAAVGEERTYVLDDDGDGSVRPDQRGVLTLAPDGSVRPQPQTSSPEGCAPVFSKAISNVATLTTTSGRNGCFPAGSTQTWLRLN